MFRAYSGNKEPMDSKHIRALTTVAVNATEKMNMHHRVKEIVLCFTVQVTATAFGQCDGYYVVGFPFSRSIVESSTAYGLPCCNFYVFWLHVVYT